MFCFLVFYLLLFFLARFLARCLPLSLPPVSPAPPFQEKKAGKDTKPSNLPAQKSCQTQNKIYLVHVYHTRERFPFRPCHATQKQTHTVSHAPACSVAPMHAQRVSCQVDRKRPRKKETNGIAQATSFAPSPLLFLLPFLGHPPAHTHLSLSQSLSLIHTHIEGD